MQRSDKPTISEVTAVSTPTTDNTPDYTFFFDLPAQISLQRIQERGNQVEYFETEKTLTSVRKTMTNLAERCAFTKRATVFDAQETPDQIFARIDMVLTPLLFNEHFQAK